MSPFLADSYSLATLQRIPDLKLSEKVVVPTINSVNTSYIDVGISKSLISSYVLKPSPKLVWSFPLSPSAIVEDLDVYELNEETKLYVVGITDRKIFKILLIKKNGETSTNYELKVQHKVKGIRFFAKGELIVVLYENGSIEQIKHEDGSLSKTENSLTNKGKVKYYSFISKNEFKNEEDLLVFVSKQGSNLTYNLISLNPARFLEVNSISRKEDDKILFAYNSGYLYYLSVKEQIVATMSISNFKVQKSISVSSLLKRETNIDDVSLLSPSPDRLLLSINDSLHLINFKFESLLTTYRNPDKVFVKQVVKVNGSSSNTSRSLAIYLNANSKHNEIFLNLINIDVGSNKLSECLGKSLNSSTPGSFKGLSNIIVDNFEEEAVVLSKELDEVYNKLMSLSKTKDIKNWERILIPYLKNQSWDSIKASLKKKITNADKVYQFQVFDVEKDRIVDSNFIRKILSLIFELTDSDIKLIKPDFLPEHSLVYLLTNPLFPHDYSKGLLKKFNELGQINLLRQCIATCSSLSIEEILSQFINLENSQEIFEDLLNRLISEFSISEITKSFKELIAKLGEIDLDSLLNKLIQLDNQNSWYLIQSIIDIGGLFNWSLDTISKLNELIESKFKSLNENHYNLTLTNQALLTSEPIKKKHSKSKKKKQTSTEDIISANDQQKLQLDSILTINNNSSKNLLIDNASSIEISKKIPNYSVEKLIL